MFEKQVGQQIGTPKVITDAVEVIHERIEKVLRI